MTTTKPVKATLRDVPALWRSRTPFDCNGTLRGFDRDYASLGMLDDRWAAEYTKAATAGEIAFVVLSYSTPIAWVLRDGTEIKISQKFSVTTSKHQGKLY